MHRYPHIAAHPITLSDLQACAASQGISDFRPASRGGTQLKDGDILFLRSGYVAAYNTKTPEERAVLAKREGRDSQFAGFAQGQDMLEWLHDGWFAAVAGDCPAFECWPKSTKYYLHEHLLSLWGCPIGEMLDLEKLARKCRERRNWFFFFTSSPANVVGGVGSHVNGLAIL